MVATLIPVPTILSVGQRQHEKPEFDAGRMMYVD